MRREDEILGKRRFEESWRETRIREAAVHGVRYEEVRLHHVWPKSARDMSFVIDGQPVTVSGKEIRRRSNQKPLTCGEHGAAHYIFAVICRQSGRFDLAKDHWHTSKSLGGQISNPMDLEKMVVMGVVGALIARKVFDRQTV